MAPDRITECLGDDNDQNKLIKPDPAMKTNLSQKSGASGKSVRAPGRLNIRNILTTTDFSDESGAGVLYGIALAEKLQASLHLIHVVEPPSRISGMEDVPTARSDSEVAALARLQLQNITEREGARHLQITSSVRIGKAFHQIAIAARESRADLIVIATHGYTGAKRIVLGSTAERVVRHAPCPVLTVPARTASRSPRFKLHKILVPIDFSTLSKDALPWAISLAGRFGAEIVLIHVVEKFPIDYLSTSQLLNGTITPLIKQVEADLKHLAGKVAKSTGLDISSVVCSGTPYEEICRASERLGADLITLTTHGYTGLKHVWLGSTAERVVRHAQRPVLAVRKRNR